MTVCEPYIFQKPTSAGFPIVCANARRFYELPQDARLKIEPEPFAPTPQRARDVLDSGRCLSMIVSTARGILQPALLIGYKDELFEVVNAKIVSEDATIEWLDWRELSLPPAEAYRREWIGCSVLFPDTPVIE